MSPLPGKKKITISPLAIHRIIIYIISSLAIKIILALLVIGAEAPLALSGSEELGTGWGDVADGAFVASLETKFSCVRVAMMIRARR